MTQCRPSGQAGQTIVANNPVPFDSVSLNANAQACRPNGQAECRPNGQAVQLQNWQQQSMASASTDPRSCGGYAAMPPLALGGSAAAGQLLIDQALAEQRSMDWHEDEERGPQPEDEPIEEACSAEKFSIGTPQGSVIALPAPEGRGHDLILPGDRRRESPRTPNRGPGGRVKESSSELLVVPWMTIHGSMLQICSRHIKAGLRRSRVWHARFMS